ncbi:hypothetical protein LCGC14_1908160 [marine sediment metagenome]|uniref:Uncharacterized protein n=1 Tax=marine sediment metagenome TaxID=412755 RepID=A0A0F9ISF5_9ZZZZ
MIIEVLNILVPAAVMMYALYKLSLLVAFKLIEQDEADWSCHD